jgi:hypothetical protein
MEVFRDLYIHCTSEQFTLLMGDVERSLTGGWTRDVAEEKRLRSLPFFEPSTSCFSCAAAGARPAATVFLTEKESGTFHVSNVVPEKLGQLSYREYNGILEEFAALLRPCADRLGVRTELTAGQADLENWLSTEAAGKLRKFSASANKGSGASHPSDRQRWNEFVVAAHEGKCDLSGSTLRRWLVEVEGWPPDVASQLAVEYEYGRELLTFAESRRSA